MFFEISSLFKVNGKLHFIAVGRLMVGLVPAKPLRTFLSFVILETGAKTSVLVNKQLSVQLYKAAR